MPAMFVVYEVLLYLVSLVALPFFLFAGFLRGKYLVNFPERSGIYRSRPRPHDLWMHAVSVGEVLASRTVLQAIERLRPATSMVITTTTITGQAQARRLFPNATITYFPFDFGFSVRRFLHHHQPRVFATIETEIWPNAARLSHRAGLRLLLANGRISDRSFPRYRAVRMLLAPVLALYDAILAREEEDRTRFIAIGARPDRVEVSGNVKFDYTPDTHPLELASELEQWIANRPVLLLGSTMEGEDEAILPLLPRFLAEEDAVVIIAPRKPERFEVVAALLETTPLAFVRRTAWTVDPSSRVLLLDSLGELARLYSYASVAFVGGSIAPNGGHNPIEPAAAGVPVCFGPSMTNFREIAGSFLKEGGATETATADEILLFARKLFHDPEERRTMGERGRKTVAQNRGASERTAQRIIELLS